MKIQKITDRLQEPVYIEIDFAKGMIDAYTWPVHMGLAGGARVHDGYAEAFRVRRSFRPGPLGRLMREIAPLADDACREWSGVDDGTRFVGVLTETGARLVRTIGDIIEASSG